MCEEKGINLRDQFSDSIKGEDKIGILMDGSSIDG